MLALSTLNSTLDMSSKVNLVPILFNIQTDPLYEFVMYGEKILSKSPILQPYNMKIIFNIEQKYRKLECIYSQGLTPTKIYSAIDLVTNERVIIKELKKDKL